MKKTFTFLALAALATQAQAGFLTDLAHPMRGQCKQEIRVQFGYDDKAGWYREWQDLRHAREIGACLRKYDDRLRGLLTAEVVG